MPIHDLERELEEMSVWPVERLVQYLVKDHETFLKMELPRMQDSARKASHGPLTQFVETLNAELRGHFKTEENIVFPVLVSMEHKDPGSLQQALQYACRHMESDHQMHEKHLRLLAAFQNELQESIEKERSDSGSDSGIALINSLDDFARRMYLHMSIENRFLFQPYLKTEDQA